MTARGCIGALIVLLIAVPAAAQTDARFSLGAIYMYGNVDGYVQTPSGGEPGTTSSKRPTLSEIGIDTTSVYDAQIIGAFGDNEFYVGGQWIRMSGSSTLDETLITNGKTFPAGSDVNADVDLDWYRFGYRRRIPLGNGDWTLWPSAGAAVLDFNYKLHGEGVSADRSYIKVNAQFGLETEWRPGGGRFSLDLVLLGTPPISSLPQVFVEELAAKYRLIENAKNQLDVEAGVALEQIYYEDNQSTPNRIKADLGPMFLVGVTWKF